MATILQRLTRALSPTVIREIAKTAGLEPELAARGMSAAVPVVMLALADKAAESDGPPTVFRMLPAAGSPMLGELAFVARAGVPDAVLAPVLGARAGPVGDRLDCALDFRASALLPIATALVLGLTARIVDEQELDAAGLAELLALEAAELRGAAGPVARLARKSLDADHHMMVMSGATRAFEDHSAIGRSRGRPRGARDDLPHEAIGRPAVSSARRGCGACAGAVTRQASELPVDRRNVRPGTPAPDPVSPRSHGPTPAEASRFAGYDPTITAAA
jgi:hypothetical protein